MRQIDIVDDLMFSSFLTNGYSMTYVRHDKFDIAVI